MVEYYLAEKLERYKRLGDFPRRLYRFVVVAGKDYCIVLRSLTFSSIFPFFL